MSTITVRTADELKAALSSATGGETIRLAAGNYGTLSIYKRTFSTPVTIQSDEGVVFETVKINGSSGVNFEGGTFFAGFRSGETWKAGIRLDNSSNVSIKGATFHGWEDDNWSNDGFGIHTRGVQNLTVEDSEFKYLLRGAIFHETDGLTLRNNTVTYMRSDGFDFAAVKDVLVEGNTMTDFPIQYGNWSTNGDHKDFIQFWTSGVNQGSENVVIRDNVLIQDGTNTQGIFIRSETGHPHKNFTIENNIVYVESFHGITLGTVQGGVVRNNTVVSTKDGAAGINISTEFPSTPSKVTLADNITPRMNIGNGSIATHTGTFLIQDDNPGAANYVGNVFPNPWSPQVGADLLPKPGTTSAGATLTPTSDGGTVGDGDTTDGGGTDGGTTDGGGEPAPAPAPEPTPTDPTSDTQSVILLNFKQAGSDPVSGLTLTQQGDVVFGQGEAQDTASFDGAGYVTLGRDARLFSSDKLSLSLDFRARGDNGNTQTMFWNHRRYGVAVAGKDLVVYLYDNASSQYVTMRARDVVTYGSWQNVTFDYSREAGVGKVWVDGTQKASVSDVAIDIGEPAHWDVVAGSDSWSKHFIGDLRNIEYLPDASGTATAPLVGASSTTLAGLAGDGGATDGGTDGGTTDPVTETPTSPTDGTDAPGDGGSTTDPVATEPLYGTAQPDVLLNFAQAGADSVSGLTLDPVGNVVFGQGEAQDTARFDGASYVKLGKDGRFFGSDEVSVSLDFKAETGDGSAQTMFWNHRRYGVTLRGDDVVVYLYDETSDKYTTLIAADAVTFGSWQNVAFDYSRQSGTAHVWVNGQQVAEKSGLSIDIGAPAHWDVVAGSDGWSKHFTGELRNIEVLADATGTGGTPLIGSHSATLVGLSPVVDGGDETPTTETPADGGTDAPADGDTDAPAETPTTETPDPVTGETPDVSLDFRAAGVDAATNLTLTPVGSVVFGQGAEGDTAVFDGNSYVKLGRDERFFGSDTLTLSLDFKAAPGHEGDTQTIVWNHRRYGVTLRGDDMVVYLHDEPSGKYTTMTIPDAVKAGTWQNVTFDYSRETGTANVWLDGETRATRDGLSIDIGEPAYWDVTVGSDGWSKHFAGEVRNLDFLAKASGDGAAPLIGPYAPPQEITAPAPAPTEPTLTRPEPDVLLNFKAAGYDATSDLTLSPTGNVLFGQGAQDTAVFDGNSYVKLGRDERFFTGDNLSMSFDFKADLKDDSVQTMVWNHMRYGVSIKGEDILVPLFDAKTGERASLTIAGAVKHGTWQNVTFEYSRDTGTANVWVDGAHRATRDGIDLDIGDPSHWDVVVGSDSWSKSFTGEVRNLEFLQQANGDAAAAPLVGSHSTTLRSLNLTDYAGVTTSTTSSLSAGDTKTADTELFTVAS